MPLPQIKISNDTLQSTLLSSVEIVQELNRHWSCTIICRQTEDNPIPVEQLLGNALEIETLDDSGVAHIHFTGFISDVQLKYEIWGNYTACIVGISSSYKLDITAHNQYYAEKTLSSIAETVAGRSGLSVSVQASSSKALNYVQYGETDFSFLNRLADDYGAWMRPNQGGVEIFDSFQAGSTVTWREESGLIEFSLHGKMAPPSFNGSHYDHHAMASNTFTQVSTSPAFYDGGQSLTSAVQSASQQLPPGFEPQRARAMTLTDYQAQLQQESERAMGAAIGGAGSSRNQNLKAGDTLQIDGVLAAKGTYGLVKVIHQWTNQGYVNNFVCTPWKKYRNPSPPAARTLNGVSPARVVDHNDPKKMGRIKIQFFWQDDSSTHWVRTVSPHAGPDRGFMFMPEVGDEVAVIFEEGDPERPLIIGSVWNGVHQAPREDYYGSDIQANDIKRVLTKSGNRMQFVDTQGKEALVLATPHSNSFTMTENSPDTGRQLVVLHTEGDIVLSAAGRIHLKAALFSHEIGGSGGTKSD